MNAPPEPVTNVGPVQQPQRIQSLDVLRGFAVLGMLVMNVQAFSMILGAYSNPTAYGHLTGANYAVWLLGHVLADRKFMTIFSVLFGAGIILMTSRRQAAGQPAAGVHYRRMAVLLIIGLLHAHLLWNGDILYHYALCGMIVYLFRRCRPVVLLILGGSAVAMASAISIFFGWSMPYWSPQDVQEITQFWAPSEETISAETDAYRSGWLGQMGQRVPHAVFFQTFVLLTEMVWRAGGLMLVGMALFKLEVLSAKRSSATYLLMISAGAFVGIPTILYGVHRNWAAQWDVRYSLFFGGQYNYWASIVVALGWVGFVMLACRHNIAPKLRRALAAVGRTALTNYLMQTVICTTIFYGHGLGMYGRVDRVGQVLIVGAVWAFQLGVSPLWLHHFRFGPVEWFWRSLTYMQAQPMRLRSAHGQ